MQHCECRTLDVQDDFNSRLWFLSVINEGTKNLGRVSRPMCVLTNFSGVSKLVFEDMLERTSEAHKRYEMAHKCQ